MKTIFLKFTLLLLMPALSFGAGPSAYTLQCQMAYGEIAKAGVYADFLKRLDLETDPDVRNFALVIVNDNRQHGAATEIGAHGKDLSWKWLGVAEKGTAGNESGKDIVVGYANPQHYPPPFNRLALDGKIPKLAVGSNTKGEVFISEKDFKKLSPEMQKKVIKALKLALGSDRVRIFTDRELSALQRDGTLPRIRGGLSLAGNDPGRGQILSMMSMAGAASSGKEPMQLGLQLDPGQVFIIGRAHKKMPDYLDPDFQVTSFASDGKRIVQPSPGDDKISRAHLSLEGDQDSGGIWIINGVPGVDGKVRVPPQGTSIKPAGKTMRPMTEGERFLVKSGTSATIRLPNGTELVVQAE